MEAVIAFLKFLIPVLPILAAALLLWWINLKKQKRHLQLFFPIVALLYGVVFLLFIPKISDWLLTGIYYLLERFADVIEKYEFLHFLNEINWSFGVMYIANFLMVLLFVVIKLAMLAPASAGHPEKHGFTSFLTGLFYTYDEKDEKWYIKDSLAQAKKVLFYIHVLVLIFSGLLFSTTCYLISKDLMSVPFYPVFGILIFGECFFFLSGLAKGGEQKPTDPPPEDEPVEEPDYSLLKPIYEALFGDRLCGCAELPPIEDKHSSLYTLLEQYRTEAEETDSHDARLFYSYFSELARVDDTLDDGMVMAARNILDGKNVLYNTPFYEDTTKYIFLPLMRHLMRNRKILLIAGRTGADQNLMAWMNKGLSLVSGFENLWKIHYLADSDEHTRIAVLPMKDIYNQALLTAKAEFLEETTLVIISDPARLLGTMQIGLSNIVSYLRRGTAPQYLAFDRNCDGLVDSLSHVLNSSIEEVTATAVGSAKNTAMIWEADGNGLHSRLGLDTARYLGIGTELGATAIAAKVSAVDWLSYERFPATDIRWIVSQYYGPLCKVMDIPVSQTELENHLRISGDLWAMPMTENVFVVAEDEFHNAYEMIRQFGSRATKQGFIHVLSPNYLLRDYMCENAAVFTYDPKAIPNIVPDYQRVLSNTVYRLTMRLINGEIYEEEIRDALELIGIETQDVYNTMVSLIVRCFLPEEEQKTTHPDGIINVRTELQIDPKTRRPIRKRVFSILNTSFVEKFLSQLQVVRYIAEDESDKGLYMNSILYGHIYQKYLPGTFTVFDGKYYEVVSITPHSGMVVRRAADHLTRRRYNRQLRTYTVADFRTGGETAASVTLGNIYLERGEAAVSVSTEGYLDLSDYGNLRNATRVTVNNVPTRSYPHKNVLRFRLNGADAKVRFTVATMINEVFVTLFPDMHEYIVATTAAQLTPQTEGLIPALCLEQEDDFIYIIEDSLIDMGLLINAERYFRRILEIITDQLSWHDSLINVDNGDDGSDIFDDGGQDDGQDGGQDDDGEKPKKRSWWRRFLDWLKRLFGGKKKNNPEAPEAPESPESPENPENPDSPDSPENPENPDSPEAPEAPEAPEVPEAPEKPKKPSIWDRIFRRKKKDEEEQPAEEPVEDQPAEEPVEEQPAEEPAEENPLPADETAEDETAEDSSSDEGETPLSGDRISFNIVYTSCDVVDDNEEGIDGEDDGAEHVSDGENPGVAGDDPNARERKPYNERFYMLYGYDAVPEGLDLSATLQYLQENGFGDNDLYRARITANEESDQHYYIRRAEPGEHYCDFCGVKLTGTWSVLKDGRERCAECEKTAITKVRDFRKIYKQIHKRMEKIFGIKIRSKIDIRITTATEIAKEFGEKFVPTPHSDARVLGFAQRLSNGKTRLFLENGSPRIETEKTLVHELTHVWQYENMDVLWNPRDPVAIEGMAVWTEAQYLVCIGEEKRAIDYVSHRSAEQSEYGQGMREYIQKYPLRKSSTATHKTPFSNPGKNPIH